MKGGTELEEEEELEPLFNYARVPPADLLYFNDDRFDCSPIFPDEKRRKTTSNSPTNEKGKEDSKCVVVLDEDDHEANDKKIPDDNKFLEDEDWLLQRPSTVPNSVLGIAEDTTLQELKLKKQELASFVISAEDVLQQIMDAAKKELNNSHRPAPLIELDEPSKPQVERQKIVICIQDKDGQKQFRMYSGDKFERAFKTYAEKAKLSLESLIFSFDGEKVSTSATPEALGLEDGDIIEVHVKS